MRKGDDKMNQLQYSDQQINSIIYIYILYIKVTVNIS